MTQLFELKVLWAKAESPYGTDPTPAKATDAILCAEMTVKPMILSKQERALVLANFGNRGQLIAGAYCQVEAKVYMSGSGVAGVAPAYGPLFKACAMSETIVADTSVTYAPIMTSPGSVTFYYYHDGMRQKITGARGNVSFTLDKMGRPMWVFTFIGLYNAPTATAFVSDSTLSAFLDPVMVNKANTSLTLHSYAANMASISGDLGVVNSYRNQSEVEEIAFVGRKSNGTVTIDAPALGTKDYFAIARAGTKGALSLVQGTTAGNIVTIAAPAVQLGEPDEVDIEGIGGLSMPLDICPTLTGNDEVTFAFT